MPSSVTVAGAILPYDENVSFMIFPPFLTTRPDSTVRAPEIGRDAPDAGGNIFHFHEGACGALSGLPGKADNTDRPAAPELSEFSHFLPNFLRNGAPRLARDARCGLFEETLTDDKGSEPIAGQISRYPARAPRRSSAAVLDFGRIRGACGSKELNSAAGCAACRFTGPIPS